MIMSRTPFRCSFFGGGSDVPWYYRQHGGRVFGSAIRQYMYVAIHPYFFKKRIRLKYSETEDVDDVRNIRHDILRVVLERFDIKGGLEIASFADVPAGTGLGSSSAFTVGLLNSLYRFHNVSVTPRALAEEACEIEIDILGNPIGKQDQYFAAFGGMNVFEFHPDDNVSVSRVDLAEKEILILEKALSLHFVESSRSASSVLSRQNSSTNRDSMVHLLGDLDRLVTKAVKMFKDGKLDISEFGSLLHEGWVIKKKFTNDISNPSIDGMYQNARASGAYGGKLLGAGSGGFLLLAAEDPASLFNTLSSRGVPFQIDSSGSTIIHDER